MISLSYVKNNNTLFLRLSLLVLLWAPNLELALCRVAYHNFIMTVIVAAHLNTFDFCQQIP